MTTQYEERTWNFGRLDDAPDGPWKDEPDKVQWVDETTGLDCLILRNRWGNLCGYVGVPETHPWYGKSYSKCMEEGCEKEYCYDHAPESLVEVHGGLTFSDFCHEGRGDDAICHVPYEGRPEVYWFGFDCGHAFDLQPSSIFTIDIDAVYRDIPYVKNEVAHLASQLAAVR